jgi:NADH:ubiquinone oxidoreductase subunit 3 (subunit A)
VLTFAAKYFYQDKYSNYKLNFYECGFKSISNLRLNFSIQFVLLAAFLIIYDSEFLILFPLAFNFFYIETYQFLIFIFFFFFLLLALLIDYVYSALD